MAGFPFNNAAYYSIHIHVSVLGDTEASLAEYFLFDDLPGCMVSKCGRRVLDLMGEYECFF